MRCHLTRVKMAIIKKSTNNKSWRGCGEKGNLLHCWWKCKLVQPLWRTVWKFLKKLKIELPYYPAIPPLSIYPVKTIIQKIHAPHYSLQCYFFGVDNMFNTLIMEMVSQMYVYVQALKLYMVSKYVFYISIINE